jgi:hypothetical protein
MSSVDFVKLKTGVVTLRKSEKGWGLIVSEGVSYLFHVADENRLYRGDDGPTKRNIVTGVLPRSGTAVMFCSRIRDARPYAKYWFLKSAFDEIVAGYGAVYRVVKSVASLVDTDERPEETTLWCGFSLAALMRKYPRGKKLDLLSPLRRDDKEARWRIEQYRPGAGWVSIDDPRLVITVCAKKHAQRFKSRSV